MSGHLHPTEPISIGNESPCVLFAGGGTGGHISPGLAIAEAIQDLRPDIARVFACSDRPIDRAMLERAGERFVTLAARPFGARPAQLLRFLKGWRSARAQTLRLIDERRISAVVALGGFVAAPAAAAARKRGAFALLLNLDAVPGKANRLMARRASKVLTTCEIADNRGRFTAARVPMPLRRSALASTYGDMRQCRLQFGFEPESPVLLVTGASQGSQGINDLIRDIVQHHRDWLEGWQILHLTGHGRESDWDSTYSSAGIRAVAIPFTHEMGLAWGAAELAISRAGANSVAEIAINAVPAVFFPYPHHADRHQFHNAQPLADAGGAVICEDFNDHGKNLHEHGETLRRLVRDAPARSAMRQSLEALRPENGAVVVARELIDAFERHRL